MTQRIPDEINPLISCIPHDVDPADAANFVAMMRTFGRFLRSAHPHAGEKVVVGRGVPGQDRALSTMLMAVRSSVRVGFPDPEGICDFVTGFLSSLGQMYTKDHLKDLAAGMVLMVEQMPDDTDET